MNRIIFALTLCLVGLGAHAETINLGSDACGLSRICYDVMNDADPAMKIDLYATPTSNRYSLILDGVVWTSQVGSGFDNIVGMAFNDGASGALTLNAAFSKFRTCTHSGRGQTCSTHYTLVR